MSNNIVPLVNKILFPKILRDLDRFFLINFPKLWTTKFYFVLYWGVMVNLAVLIIVNIYIVVAPVDRWIMSFKTFSLQFWLMVGMMIVFEMLCFIGWLGWIRQYCSEWEYAPFKAKEEMLFLAVYALCLFVFISPSAIVIEVVKKGIQNKLNEATVIQDSNYLDGIYAALADKIVAIQTCEEVNTLSTEKPNIDFGILRRYTLVQLDENILPFDWSRFGIFMRNAQENVTNLKSFAFENNRLLIAVILGFINVGLIAFLAHYFIRDYFYFLFAGALFFIFACIVFESPLAYLFEQYSSDPNAIHIFSVVVWVFTVFLLSFTFSSLHKNQADKSLLAFSVALSPIFVYYSIALLLIFIFPNSKNEGLYGIISTFSYVPIILPLKKRLLSIFASAQFWEQVSTITR